MQQTVIKIIAILVFGLAIPLFLVMLVWGHIHTQFTGEFTQHMGSIEVSYIQMAKFIKASLPEFAWQPRWYLGYPMSVLYTPFIPAFEYLAHVLVGWSFGHAYRVLTGAAYIGVLVSLYFFVRALFSNTVAGLVSALVYGLAPSIIAYLYSDVAGDTFASELIEPRRFTILVRWGEGPHIVSLFFLCFAALGWIKFLRSGSKWQLLFGAVMTALTALTNSVGAWGLALLILALLFGEIAENPLEWKQKIARVFLLGITSYGIAAFWYNPLFITAFFQEGGGTLSRWRDAFPWGWLIVLTLFVTYFFIAKKILSRVKGLTAGLMFFVIVFWLVNTYYGSGSEKIEWVPQVLRLTTEVDMGLSIVIGAAVALIGVLLLKTKKFVYYGVMIGIAAIAVVVSLPRAGQLASVLPKHALPLEAVGKKLEDTPEYEIAKTLETKVASGERVFVPGNYSFYLNYFTDIPQIRGALFQAETHPWPEHIYYQLANGKDSNVTLAWLKIANIGWLVYNGPREMFQDYKVKRDKFDEVLTLDTESQGDLFYKVPLKDASLAKAVPKSIVKAIVPKNAIDKPPIFDYVNHLESSNNELTLTEEKNGVYKIQGTLDPEESLLVQLTHIVGWSAKDQKGRSLSLRADPFGFILIEPRDSGLQDITLTYNTPLVVWLGRILTLVTIILVGVLLLKVKKPLVAHTSNRPKSASVDDE